MTKRARDEAFRKAAEHEAELQDYDRMSTAALEEWIKGYMDRHQETWNVVWKAARKAERSRWDNAIQVAGEVLKENQERLEITRSNLDAVIGTAKSRLEKIREQARTITALRAELDEVKKKLERVTATLAAQRESGRTLLNENNRLRDERTALQDELEETKKHTTSATWKVFEENERLVAENRRISTLLADSEEIIKDKERLVESLRSANKDCMEKRDQLIVTGAMAPSRPPGEGWNLIWVRHNDFHDGVELPAGTWIQAPSRVQYGVTPCSNRWIMDGYTHHCTEPRGHIDRHRCHCGATRRYER